MIRLVKVIFLLLIATGSSFSQSFNIGAGVSFGGPIPVEVVDSTSGKPLMGAIGGLTYTFPLSESFSFRPGIYYSFRGLDYSQSYTRDTLYTFEINGTSGTVPSFYTAYVNGNMRLHYIDIPLLIGYKVWKFDVLFGPYFSILLAGKDDGDVRVVIGSGGFFDDVNESFNNYHALRSMEHGIMLGSSAPVFKNLGIEMKVSRSFFTLYNLKKLPDRGQGLVKMYSTYIQIGLTYKIPNSKKIQQD